MEREYFILIDGNKISFEVGGYLDGYGNNMSLNKAIELKGECDMARIFHA